MATDLAASVRTGGDSASEDAYTAERDGRPEDGGGSQRAPSNSTQAGRLTASLSLGRAIWAGADDRARTQRDALVVFAVRVLSAAVLYLTQIVLARWMGGFEYGIYVFVWTWVLVLSGVAELGLSLSVIRLAPEYKERGEAGLLRGVVFSSRVIATAAGAVVTLVGVAALYVFEPLSGPYILPAYLALICIPLVALGDVQDGLGRGLGWMGLALVPKYLVRPIFVLIAMAAAHLAGLPLTATTAASAAIIATWFSTLAQTLLLNRRLAATMAPAPRAYDPHLWAVTSAPLLAILVFELILQNADILIVSRYMSPTDVGIYFAAAKTMSLIMFVHYAVGSAVANRFASLKARGDTEALDRFVGDAVNWTFWPSLASAVVILLLGKPLLSLFGEAFVDGYPVMVILVIGFLFRSAVGPADFLLNMVGEQLRCAAVLGVMAALNIVLNLVLVPHYGLIGAATATSMSLAFAAVAHYIVVRRRLGFDIGIWANLPGRRARDQ